jgi:Ca2+-binding RTX toxin-like protein
VTAHGGDDRVVGGGDRDWIFGGPGDDTLIGGDGNDTLRDPGPHGYDPPDADKFYGGPDPDWIDARDGDADDVVSCGEGRDTVRFDKIGTASDKLEACEVRYPNPDY